MSLKTLFLAFILVRRFCGVFFWFIFVGDYYNLTIILKLLIVNVMSLTKLSFTNCKSVLYKNRFNSYRRVAKGKILIS